MKLFKEFEAVKFREEDAILITQSGYLYYIYDTKYRHWRKHENAGNDHITVENYDDVSKEEIMDSLGGCFPQKETDFLRFCDPRQLWVGDLFCLLKEDYPDCMTAPCIFHTTHRFLLESDIRHRTYESLRELFDDALAAHLDHKQLLSRIKELSLTMTGRDIFKPEIGIVDGHDCSSYFWIMPVRVIDYSDTDSIDSVAEMKGIEISIEENDVYQFLAPFLRKHFDEKTEANKNRHDAQGFEWNLTYNFFCFDSIKDILKDIKDTMDALASGRDNEFTAELRKQRVSTFYRDLEERTNGGNPDRSEKETTDIDLIIDFYRRFVYRMEYMMKVGEEKGYDLISFMGP